MVAMELYYLGFDCDGFACQPDNERTIEAHIFRAMRSTCMVPETATYEQLQYTRCGRTDKGVSAYRQVISLRLRSKVKKGQPLPGIDEETDYVNILNRCVSCYSDRVSQYALHFSSSSYRLISCVFLTPSNKSY